MGDSRTRRARPSRLLVVILLMATGQASANFYDLLRRAPESANTIVLIDVERMLMSPIAMKEKWRDKGNSEGVTLHFPINAVRYMLASKLDFISHFEDQGDVALIETPEGVSLPYLAKTEGGYLDTIDGQEVAFSPRNAFFVSFKPNILGVSFPANRQELGRWLTIAQAGRPAAGLRVPAAGGQAGPRQGSHGHRHGPGGPAHAADGPRPAPSRREPGRQEGRPRHAHQGARFGQGRDPDDGGDRQASWQDPARSRRVRAPRSRTSPRP